VLAQTPQAFTYALLRDAFRKAQQDGVTARTNPRWLNVSVTTCSSLLGSERNIKITRPSDMDLARFYLEAGAPGGEGVTFAPGPPQRMGLSPVVRTVLFW